MPSLVPDRAFAQLVEDDQAREALKPVQRSKRPPKAMTLVVKRIARQQDRLVPREDEAATRSRLEALGPSAAGAVRAAVPTKPLTKTAAKATAAKRAAASAVRTRKVTSVLRELSRLASGRRAVQATPAQLASLTRLAGTLPAELESYFGFAANPDDTFSTSADVEPLLSLAGAMRTMKALRRYEFPETLVPLLDYQDGNFACFDVETSHVMFWDHETRGTSKLAPDLGTALEWLRLRPSRAASKKARVGRGRRTRSDAAPPRKTARDLHRIRGATAGQRLHEVLGHEHGVCRGHVSRAPEQPAIHVGAVLRLGRVQGLTGGAAPPGTA